MSFFYALLVMLLLNLSVSRADAPLPVVKAGPVLLKKISVAVIGASEVHESLRLPARVELDQQHVARIGATVTGRITEIQAGVGEKVRKNQRLATLNSTELGLAQSAYLKTSSQVNLRRLAVERAKRLLASDVIAAAELQERESMLNDADVDLRTATDQLRVFGMSDADLSRLSKERKINSSMPITATIQGTIVERKVTVGQVVEPTDALFTVADLSHVVVVAELPEQQANWVHKGDEAVVTIAALPDQEIHGRLVYVADLVDPDTRTITLKMALNNPRHIFKPQMLATLRVNNHGGKQLVLQDSAVFRLSNNDYVFVQTGTDEFQLRPVQLGAREGNVRRIFSGLKAGEKVVVDGAFHLNSELLLSGLKAGEKVVVDRAFHPNSELLRKELE